MIEYLSWNKQEPLSSQSSSIITWLIDKGYLNLSLQLTDCAIHELIVWSLEKMSSIYFDVDSSAGLLSELGMVSEDEFFSFEVQKMRLFQYDTNWLFVKIFTLLIEVFDDLEMNLFMFQ